MPTYNRFPAVDENFNFPPQIVQAFSVSPDLLTAIAGLIANNPSVVTAAANTAQSTANIVLKNDPRLLNVNDVENILWGVVDNMDRETALMLGYDGNLTQNATKRIGGSLGVLDVPLDSSESFAFVDKYDRIIFSDLTIKNASSTTVAQYPSLDHVHWGDSMTDDIVLGVDAWTRKLALLTGRKHYNAGWYGQTAEQIAARQGGLPAIVTVLNNATATSGPTVVTGIVNKPVKTSSTRFVHGTLAGIPGKIQEPTDGNVQFIPDLVGVFPIPAASIFIPDDAVAYRDRIMTIWSGRNDVPLQTDPQLVVAGIRAAIDYLSTSVKRVIVMEVVPSIYDDSAARAYTATLNVALKAAFPAYWLAVATYLRTDAAATAAGVTFTSQDRTDIANGNTPTSFRLPGDSTHINAAGCIAVANLVYQEEKRRGWLP